MIIPVVSQEDLAMDILLTTDTDIILVSSIEGCCDALILVKASGYTSMFDDWRRDYTQVHRPVEHNRFEMNTSLEEAKAEVQNLIPEAIFKQMDASV